MIIEEKEAAGRGKREVEEMGVGVSVLEMVGKALALA